MPHSSSVSRLSKSLPALFILLLAGLTGFIIFHHRPSNQQPHSNKGAETIEQAGLSRTGEADATEAMRDRVREAYGKLPLSFEANLGQTDERVQFLPHGSGDG